MRPRPLAALIAAGLALASLAAPSVADAQAVLPTSDGPVTVESWCFVLQGSGDAGLSADALAASPYGMVVTDYSRNGRRANKFTRDEVRRIRDGDAGDAGDAGEAGGDRRRKVVVSYLSIGEAGDFRDDYWDPEWTRSGEANSPLTDQAPSFLGPVNPNWPECRKVRYWQSDWRDLMFNDAHTGYVDQVIAQGFDGAYLDIVDGYYFWGVEISRADQRPDDPTGPRDAARRMIRFVVDLAAHARLQNPAFLVIPQNGQFLLQDAELTGPEGDALRDAYLGAISGIGNEDTYYHGGRSVDNDLRPDEAKIAILKRDFLGEGKPVFVAEYLTDPAKVREFADRARADGFIPYVAPRRELDVIGPPVPAPAGGVPAVE